MKPNLGPLPEPDMRHEKARDDPNEETSYGAEAMEAERQRCYALGVAAERQKWSGLMQEVLDADTNDYVLGQELADRLRAALRACEASG